MTPDDLVTVRRSWDELRDEREALFDGLARRLASPTGSPTDGAGRATYILGAVEELVHLLPSPSRLAVRARTLARSWPDPLRAPTFAVEGRAWMGAAGECSPGWCDHTEAAWRQAWHLLAEVLAAETLSPFRDGPGRPGEPARRARGDGSGGTG